MNRAIFLDRDGVLIHNRAKYIRTWDDVKIYPFTFQAISALAKLQYKIIVLTNQSAIGRGLVNTRTIHEINQQLENKIQANGGRIDRFYLCPHAPQDRCECRKPRPGLVFQAQNDFDIDLENSWLIGDAYTDILAGVNSGIKNLILVQTGRGKKQLKNFWKELDSINYLWTKNLWEAIKLIKKSLP